MPKKISAVVLNYKHQVDTINCLEALTETDLGRDIDYYIVDNSPNKEVEKDFQSRFPKVNYTASPANLGFAAGNNLAIKKALKSESQYILIINPDVTVNHDFFVPLLKNFSDPSVGIVAPVIYHSQNGKYFYGLDGSVNWKLAKPQHRNLTVINNRRPINSEFVTFACVLISADTFKKTGLLDEGYFMYLEDVDYCLSARKAGQRIILDPSVVVSHRTSSSFAKPTDKLFISFKSQLHFINKQYGPHNRIVPYLYAITSYTYLYVLWTYHSRRHN